MGTNGNNTQFEFNPEGNKLVINSSGIFPASANTLNLGSSGQQFNCIYAYKLYSNGSSVVVSDYREKNNIEELSEDAIAKVCRLRAISYKLNGENGRMQFSAAAQERSEYDEYGRRIHNNAEEAAEKEKQEQHRLTENNQTYFGLIAQEVKEVFPEIVEYDSVTDRWSKIKKIKRIKG